MKKLSWVWSAGVITLITLMACASESVEHNRGGNGDQFSSSGQESPTDYDTLDSTVMDDDSAVNEGELGETEPSSADESVGGTGSTAGSEAEGVSTGTATGTNTQSGTATGAGMESDTDDAVGGTSDTGGSTESGSSDSGLYEGEPEDSETPDSNGVAE